MMRLASSMSSSSLRGFGMSEEPSYYTLRSLAHDRELAAALGDMIIAWAAAEKSIIGTQARILGVGLNIIQAGFYRFPTFEARIKFTRAILTEWKTDQFDKAAIDKAIEKLSALSTARNHWIHGDWCGRQIPSDIEVVIFDHRSPTDSPKRRKPVKAADICNHTEAVNKRAKHLAELTDFQSIPI